MESLEIKEHKAWEPIYVEKFNRPALKRYVCGDTIMERFK